MARMFGTTPKLLVKDLSTRQYRKMRAYYRIVSGYKAPVVTDDGLTVQSVGLEIEKDAVIHE